ncbi:eryA [Symbiodinium pilosum]|uniref:EryA protein n=1 Tax=Symbiodinium pilosum TaxID=2952 RepID=A0A812J290_SYMPI|nr:eryA [Symbiodinium pilosum]
MATGFQGLLSRGLLSASSRLGRSFATTETPFLYRFKAKRLKWKKRHYNEVLIMADRRKLLETLQEVIDAPGKQFPKPFWEVLSKRCIKSMHLLEPLELAIVARAFDVHQPELRKDMDVFPSLAAQVRDSRSFVPGMAIIALSEIFPRRLRHKEEVAELMKLFARRAANCMWEIPVDAAVSLIEELAASGVKDAALCRRVAKKLQIRLTSDLWEPNLGLLGQAAAALAAQDFRDVELFRSLVESAARCLEGSDGSADRASGRAVLDSLEVLKLELPEAEPLRKALEVT